MSDREIRRRAAMRALADIMQPSPLLVGCSTCGATDREECRIIVGDPDMPRPYYHQARRAMVFTYGVSLLEDLIS